MKTTKELHERRQEEKIEGQDIFYILRLFLGSTAIQWVMKFFLNTNEMVESPCESVKCVSRFWVYMPKFGI